MGTSIDCFFAHDSALDALQWQHRLNEASTSLASDLEFIRVQGRFSSSKGNWWVSAEEPNGGESLRFVGEGPAGFGISIYRNVICLTSNERMHALYDPSYGVAVPLRRVLCSLAVALVSPHQIAVAAAGFGDTDAAEDIAYGGGSFEEVCSQLAKSAGTPASTWEALSILAWFLGPARPS
jgi:hypothetical protein